MVDDRGVQLYRPDDEALAYRQGGMVIWATTGEPRIRDRPRGAGRAGGRLRRDERVVAVSIQRPYVRQVYVP